MPNFISACTSGIEIQSNPRKIRRPAIREAVFCMVSELEAVRFYHDLHQRILSAHRVGYRPIVSAGGREKDFLCVFLEKNLRPRQDMVKVLFTGRVCGGKFCAISAPSCVESLPQTMNLPCFSLGIGRNAYINDTVECVWIQEGKSKEICVLIDALNAGNPACNCNPTSESASN